MALASGESVNGLGQVADADGRLVVVARPPFAPTRLYNQTQTWANSAPAATEKDTADLTPPAADLGSRDVLVTVRNPSSVTALTVEVQVKYTDPVDGATTRYSKLTAFTVAAANAGGESFLVAGALVTGTFRLALKNSTVLGSSDTFAASIQAYQL